MPDGSASAHLYRPKLLTILLDRYSLGDLRRDAAAGLTVAVVALPLSMAIAVASGVSPARGLYTAIVGGFVVSALGGSRFQIGGPAGAFIVLVAAESARAGLSGLLTAVALSGVFLALLGALRVGGLVRHIPHAVTVGFTAAIAVTIAASQLKDLGGLTLPGGEPGPLLPKLAALAHALPSGEPAAVAVGVGVVAVVLLLRRWRPSWPGMLLALVAASAAVLAFDLPVETVGHRFGALPHGLPMPILPDVSPAALRNALPAAMAFTLLGAVESLLSAKVADTMSGGRHRANMELVAQGAANLASPLFGGICVTGTIARTAANVRAGARSPVAGLLHATFLLLFMAAGADLAGLVPLSALAGVLVVVAWNMTERADIGRLLRRWPTAVVLLATFGVTLLRDLSAGILAGCLAAGLVALLGRRVPAEDA